MLPPLSRSMPASLRRVPSEWIQLHWQSFSFFSDAFAVLDSAPEVALGLFEHPTHDGQQRQIRPPDKAVGRAWAGEALPTSWIATLSRRKKFALSAGTLIAGADPARACPCFPVPLLSHAEGTRRGSHLPAQRRADRH